MARDLCKRQVLCQVLLNLISRDRVGHPAIAFEVLIRAKTGPKEEASVRRIVIAC